GCLTGGSISSIRAIGMFLIYILADVLGESYDSLTALALMADLLVIDNPLVLKNISFIYSFGAILCILLIVLPISKGYMKLCNQRDRLRIYDNGYSDKNKVPLAARFVKWLVGSMVFSVGIYVSMLPIVTNMNYETPIYSAFLNMLLLPMMPFLLGFGLIGGFIGLLSISFARLILFPCHIVITCFKTAAAIASKMPFATAIIGKHGVFRTVAFYILMAIIVRALENRMDYYNGACSINPRARLSKCSRTFVVACIMGICVGLLWFIPTKHSFEIDILDVGQGDGIYISSGDGVSFFIDGGSTSSDAVGKYTMEPFLKYKGVSRIDYWFLSHMDLDHVSGVLELLNLGYEIDNIVLSSEIPEGDTLTELLELARKNHTNILYMKQGDICGTKHLKFKCIFPSDKYTSDDINALSLCLLMEYDEDLDGDCEYSGFFGGDIGQEQERAIADSGLITHVNLLKVSHHGSRFSSDEEFLAKLSPDIAVVSCAKVNRYGHPADEAVARLEKSAGKIYYTMNSGRVRINERGIDEYVKIPFSFTKGGLVE
ncbi:MAG: ComEC/Rec2 family competence protein, partial [Pseudobutyrivibrio sp.]|nr:ComEC/Rec2 family competence protein [Pseudobutyrivibrio sp.]